jgi:uncharacterized protein (TIGR03435 family)
MQAKAILAFAFLAATVAFAQSKPTFDAASVKPQDPSVPRTGAKWRGGPGTNDPGRITYNHVEMRDLLMQAYGVGWDQIAGPKWVNDPSTDYSDSFAITATMPKDTTVEQFQLMLRNLLAERFHLVVHHETKGFPGYELTVAPGGSKLKESPEDNAVDTGRRGPMANDANGFPLRLPGSSGQGRSPRPGKRGMFLSSNRVSMAQFTQQLGMMINQSNAAEFHAVVPRVVDKTGLTGVYEFTLGFAGINILRGGPPDGAADAPDPGETGPTLFTALEKQLGLNLTKVKDVPVDMLVVDHVDKTPTEN